VSDLAPSPAAIRLKHARQCFSRLKKRTQSGSVEDFSLALGEMIASAPSKTSSLHSWRTLALLQILYMKDAALREAKMMVFCEQCEDFMAKDAHVLSQAVRFGCAGSIRALLDAGASPLLDDHQKQQLASYTARGIWMHLDRLDPSHFLVPPHEDVLTGEMAKNLFDPGLYVAGKGFFQSSFIDHLAKMPHPSSIGRRVKEALVSVKLHPGLEGHPWAQGLAKAIDYGLLSVEDLDCTHRKDIEPYLHMALSELQCLKLARSTPSVPSVPRASHRL
jgi:hypothetical protein